MQFFARYTPLEPVLKSQMTTPIYFDIVCFYVSFKFPCFKDITFDCNSYFLAILNIFIYL